MVFRTLKWPSAWITHLKNIWPWLQHFLLIIPNPTYHPLACCVFYNRKSVDSILSWSKINKKKKFNVMVPWCLLHKLSTIQGTSAGTLKSLLPKSWGSPLQRIKKIYNITSILVPLPLIVFNLNNKSYRIEIKLKEVNWEAVPSNFGFSSSRRFFAYSAFEKRRSRQHKSRW